MTTLTKLRTLARDLRQQDTSESAQRIANAIESLVNERALYDLGEVMFTLDSVAGIEVSTTPIPFGSADGVQQYMPAEQADVTVMFKGGIIVKFTKPRVDAGELLKLLRKGRGNADSNEG